MIPVKICGITSRKDAEMVVNHGASAIGMIFYQKSPRFILPEKTKKWISTIPNNIKTVGVFVNEKQKNINTIVEELDLDYIQLHGNEDKYYISEIKKKNSIKIIKNISINSKEDLLKIEKYPNADFLLFDYKPTEEELPGGNAKRFSWDLVKDIKTHKPWFLSGGINIKNIKEIENYAIPYGIDISSGVEDQPGIKNIKKIEEITKVINAQKKFI